MTTHPKTPTRPPRDTASHALELEDFELESGRTLRPARLVYQLYGELDEHRSNVILFPTAYADGHRDNEWLIGPGRALDPATYCIVVPNLFGNGISSSPSTTPPPQDRARFPTVTVRDNVRAQHRLLRHLGVDRVQMVIGWSLAACQTYQWAISYPELVQRALPFCGAPKVSNHFHVFAEGLEAALTTDPAFQGGWYDRPPHRGLRAFARAFAPLGFSQAFYRQETYRELGFSSIEDVLVGLWEATFISHDANDLLAMLRTGRTADIGATPGFDGDLEAALRSISAHLISISAEKDLYFPPEDEAWAVSHIPGGEAQVLPGTWGHQAGRGINPADVAFIDDVAKELLARPVR